MGRCFLLIFCYLIMHHLSYAQVSIGAREGVSMTGFFDYSKEANYYSSYSNGIGNTFSLWVENYEDSTSRWRVGIQYALRHADVEVNYEKDPLPLYRDLNYTFQTLSLNLGYTSPIYRKWMTFSLQYGVTASYVMDTKVQGEGWEYFWATPPPKTREYLEWTKSENNSKDINRVLFGVALGAEFAFPITDKFEALLLNNYELYLMNVLKVDGIKYTSMFSGSLNVGVRYSFTKPKKGTNF